MFDQEANKTHREKITASSANGVFELDNYMKKNRSKLLSFSWYKIQFQMDLVPKINKTKT